MSALGTNLTNHPNLEFLEARSAEGLKSMLSQVRFPYKLLAIYFDGKKHIAWISGQRKITKIQAVK